jgi:hypothetical protein
MLMDYCPYIQLCRAPQIQLEALLWPATATPPAALVEAHRRSARATAPAARVEARARRRSATATARPGARVEVHRRLATATAWLGAAAAFAAQRHRTASQAVAIARPRRFYLIHPSSIDLGRLLHRPNDVLSQDYEWPSNQDHITRPYDGYESDEGWDELNQRRLSSGSHGDSTNSDAESDPDESAIFDCSVQDLEDLMARPIY